MSENPRSDSHRPAQEGLLVVVGARPNFVKAAPILRALAVDGTLPVTLVHTGQHYGPGMQGSFFDELSLPVPDVDLGVGSGRHAPQTAEIMARFDPVLQEAAPRGVVVVGDVNSTFACALVAAKEGVPVAHVEAGLRSRDRRMPEEINRVLTDQLATLHFTTERGARRNLLAEGISRFGIHFVGNVMIDSLLHHRGQAVEPAVTLARRVGPEAAEAIRDGFAFVTLHRPSNVDDPATLADLVGSLEEASERLPLVFAVHPRTARALDAVRRPVGRRHPVILLPPLGYLEALGMVSRARAILTDSGGLQEESTAFGVPCLTLRDTTERPVTVTEGTNTLTGRDRATILNCLDATLAGRGKAGRVPELWDGVAGPRITSVLIDQFATPARPAVEAS